MKHNFASLQERVLNLPFTFGNPARFFRQVNMIDELQLRSREALIRATIWAFVGSLYGMIFIFFHHLAVHWDLSIPPVLIACTLAATIAALIYSSMRLAVIVTPISSVACLFYVVSNGSQISLLNLTLSTALIGSVAGAVYGLKARDSRVFRADAKTLSGVCAGAIVAVVIFLLGEVLPGLSMSLTIALACLLTGTLYVTFAPFFVRRFHELLPAVGDGAMVGAGTSVFIALLFFIMITGVTPETAGSLQPLTEQIRASFSAGAFGGMLGGGLSGLLSGFLLRKWQDL